jgi:predicted nucleic acid-binding protein
MMAGHSHCHSAADRPVLIDTSVWIEALQRDGCWQCRRVVEELVSEGRAATCEVIMAELLRGARDDGEGEKWSQMLRALEVLQMDGVAEVAGRIGRACQRQGWTQPLGDVLVAAVALKHGAALLHRDRHLSQIAELMGMEEEKLEG